MLKSTITKLFLILGIIIFLLSSVGCNSSNTFKNPPSVTPPLDPPNHMSAEPYAQIGVLSSVFSLELKVKDDVIYVNDTPYKYVSYEEDLELTYESFMPIMRSEKEANATIEKLKAQKGCHVIEKQGGENPSNRIAVYYIDGSYYFVTYNDSGEAIRVHKQIVSGEYSENILKAWTGDFSEDKLIKAIKSYQNDYKSIVFQSEADASIVTFETPFEISSCSVTRLSVVDDNDINVELRGSIYLSVKTSFDKNKATVSTNWWLSNTDWTRNCSVWSYLVHIKDVYGAEHYYYFRVDYSNVSKAE